MSLHCHLNFENFDTQMSNMCVTLFIVTKPPFSDDGCFISTFLVYLCVLNTRRKSFGIIISVTEIIVNI